MNEPTPLTRAMGFIDPAGVREKQLKEAEKTIIATMTDKQLTALMGHMGDGVREQFFRRHPDVEQRVHLYGMRKLVKMIQESSEET